MRILVILAAFALSTATAQAQYLNRVAASGKQIKLGFFGSANPDCSSAGDPTVRVTQTPEHGRVSTPAARDFPTFSQSNVRSVCNTRRLPGRVAWYTSQRGFVGTDQVVLEVFYTSGVMRRYHYAIEVR